MDLASASVMQAVPELVLPVQALTQAFVLPVDVGRAVPASGVPLVTPEASSASVAALQASLSGQLASAFQTPALTGNQRQGFRIGSVGLMIGHEDGSELTEMPTLYDLPHAPAWFIAGLPPEPLDGELWIARGRFDALSGIVRRQVPRDADWRQIRYMVFEQPDGAGTFTERIERLRGVVARADVPWLQLVEQFRVADRQALQARLDEVVAGGGEGLMLHRDDAPYLTGRSDALLKLKP